MYAYPIENELVMRILKQIKYVAFTCNVIRYKKNTTNQSFFLGFPRCKNVMRQ